MLLSAERATSLEDSVRHSPLRVVILKVASRCNLACSYCYVYNKGDDSWRTRPVLMADATFRETVQWLHRQRQYNDHEHVTLLFHGGEPLLIGSSRLDAWCREATKVLGREKVSFAVQTNGVLIDEHWIEVFRRHDLGVGVSLDGPLSVNDKTRFDHQGRGSYRLVRAGIQRLQEGGVPWGLLSVVDLEHESLEIHRHLLDDVGATSVDYLIPDHTHETIDAVRSKYGATPLSDWLIPVFDDWWARDSIRVRVRTFDAIIGSILQNRIRVGHFGNPPLGYLVVEADGSIEGLDVLKICEPGLAETGLTVRSEESLVSALPPFHRETVFEGVPLPTGCHGCREASTCSGGWLPHRFSRARNFDNPSAWCADLLKLFGHVRSRLNLTQSSHGSLPGPGEGLPQPH